jgi:hypothetical protein
MVIGVVLIAIFVAVFRQRIFLRDPLGKVERNGVAQEAARVYINYSNDVLVEDAATHGFVLVQGWSKVPGVPQHLSCLNALACWTDADQAAVLPLGGSGKGAHAEMSAKEISFMDSTGEGVRVVLR